MELYDFFHKYISMRVFHTPNKQNNYVLGATVSSFFPQVSRYSEVLESSSSVQDQSQPKLKFNQTNLNNFRKNKNKVENNILRERIRTGSKLKQCNLNMLGGRKFRDSTQNTQRKQLLEVQSKKPHMKKNSCISFVRKSAIDLQNDIIRKQTLYPRYKVLQLYALYRSLLQYSNQQPSKFLQAFESSLTYNKITIRAEVIKKNLQQQKRLGFHEFVAVYKQLEDLMFIQSIIDYLEIIFEAYSLQKMKYGLVYEILAKRSKPEEAKAVTETIFRKLSIDRQGTVELNQILNLCQSDLQLCSTFSQLQQQSKETL